MRNREEGRDEIGREMILAGILAGRRLRGGSRAAQARRWQALRRDRWRLLTGQYQRILQGFTTVFTGTNLLILIAYLA